MAVRRTPRSIRFSNREWEAIVAAAAQRDMQPGEFVRLLTTRALSPESAQDEALVTPELVELIQRTFRGVHLLASLKREQLGEAGQEDRLERAAEAARIAQTETLGASN